MASNLRGHGGLQRLGSSLVRVHAGALVFEIDASSRRRANPFAIVYKGGDRFRRGLPASKALVTLFITRG